MRLKELPKAKHDKLVRDYWKTWLAAFKFQVKDKDSFEKIHDFNFSLLPIYELPTEKNCLIISKASEISPNISDLKGTPFHENLKNYYPEKPIAFFNIGTQLSPYLKSLRELRYLHYATGELSMLEELLATNQFNQCELSWIGDFNPKMHSLFDAIGAEAIKIHYTYRKLF